MIAALSCDQNPITAQSRTERKEVGTAQPGRTSVPARGVIQGGNDARIEVERRTICVPLHRTVCRRLRGLPDSGDALRGYGAGRVGACHPAICLGQFWLAVES